MTSQTKTVQHFSDEALDRAKDLTTTQIIEFIENFRNLHFQASLNQKSVLISMKVPNDLLQVFKMTAQLKGKRYQSWIKELMWKAIEMEDTSS